jgi:hypothetical protein
MTDFFDYLNRTNPRGSSGFERYKSRRRQQYFAQRYIQLGFSNTSPLAETDFQSQEGEAEEYRPLGAFDPGT